MLRKKPVIVRQVFADGLQYEFELIRSAVLMYRFVSMDTEFPGTIFKPSKQIIQEGDPAINYELRGNLPDFGTGFCYVMEFNFSNFDVDEDNCDLESIELLKRQDTDFVKNREKGITSSDFAILMCVSIMS
ncbi:probable CCR4-associated factor 1 homolog 11 [Hibiscus syriacus]|uniref:probable CCR4-associated factor 1 homolog 11 n=1 Tax=Hibiscus syriacus TaxID=106335 RepID=UPI001922DF92|nr:probable CCR4-associated factor 1 homolog 11 [Hibiscus syriacus]